MRLADPFYYLRNFQAMIDTVRARDGDLLEADEREFSARLADLPLRARALLVRMVMRKGALFRAGRLVYSEIGDVAAAVAPLVAMGWVEDAPHVTLDEWFGLLSKAELFTALALPRRAAAVRKAELLETLRREFPADQAAASLRANLDERVYRLTVDDLCERLRLMFFGNFRQNLTDFVLADLRVFQFEKIELARDARPFQTRRQVDAFLGLYRCRERLHAGKDPLRALQALPAPIPDCEWLAERRDKLRYQIARALERAGSGAAALEIYADCAHPDAGRRAALVQGRLCPAPKRRTPRLGTVPPHFVLTLARPISGTSVETLVRLHLGAVSGEETQLHHVENALINSLFGLLCWRAVFAPLPGAFFHGFHHGPADLASAGFVKRRAREFAACLAELDSGAYVDTIRRQFAEKAGISSPFVAWGLLTLPLLETALTCFPAAHLAHWFEWILRDVSVNRSGFPDLVQFWPAAGRYRLIEVKGPGDRLQPNQRRCLEHCLLQGLPVSVCHVRWEEPAASAHQFAAA
jgi:hypothetical protein